MSLYLPHNLNKDLSYVIGFLILMSMIFSVGYLQAGEEDPTPENAISLSIEGAKRHIETVGLRIAAARQAETQSAIKKDGIFTWIRRNRLN